MVYPVSTGLAMDYDDLSRLTNRVDAGGETRYVYAGMILAKFGFSGTSTIYDIRSWF